MSKRTCLTSSLIAILLLMVATSCNPFGNEPKLSPEIAWENPSDITYGTKLGSVQLNATSSIDGVFTYDPPAETVLSEGNNLSLSVTFTPNDLDEYKPVTKTVKINVISPTLTDIDGNTYKIITIGKQIWMAENLRVSKYRNGDAIENISNNEGWQEASAGAYNSYGNTDVNQDVFGFLYNGFAVADNRNLAPEGWRVPTEDDWNKMLTHLDGVAAGGKLKEASTTYWEAPNTNATNETGFAALPGGLCGLNESTFHSDINKHGYFWSSTSISDSNLRFFTLAYDTPSCGPGSAAKQLGLSVRCIRVND